MRIRAAFRAGVAAAVMLAAACGPAGAQAVFSDSFEFLTPPDDAAAARFLDQATWGGRLQDIAHLRAVGYRAWLEQQAAAPISRQKTYVDWVQDVSAVPLTRIEAFFVHAAQLPDASAPQHAHDDQLRQRLAYAWSQLFVISDQSDLRLQEWALADYYDTLAQHAFGNYREMLEAVTLHPAMGRYLGMLGNRKADAALAILPDENYAREILQLFSIGLVELELDGSVRLVGGEPVPTYQQPVVNGFAQAFTGWNFLGCTPERFAAPGFACEPSNINLPGWVSPMQPVEVFHDTTTDKQLLVYPGVGLPNGVLVHGGDARQELEAALDNIFHHPNVGPFIARHLIQRLVTSNPSPDYVRRVAGTFNDNGAGVRGDLAAVTRAVLLDPEALHGTGPTFGKLREPITKLVRLWRVAPPRSVDGRVFRGTHPQDEYGQRPLSSPSVFNFFLPDFSQPGEIRDAGLVSPEFQIHNDTRMVSIPNALGTRLFHFHVGSQSPGAWENGAPVPQEMLMDYAALEALAADPDALLDHLELVLMSGRLSDYLRDIVMTRVQAEAEPRARVQHALYLLATSPEFAVQR